MVSMASRKVLEMNSASMVGLKAELYRKREEALKTTASGQFKRPPVHKKTPLWARKNTDVSARAAKDGKGPSESAEDLLEKSRQALEAKSRLYEELSQAKLPVPNPDEDGGFLVDFERKVKDKEEEEKEKEEEREEGSSDLDEADWVEYVDAFGRSRRCLREELPHHLTRNDELRQSLTKTEHEKKEEEEADEEESEGEEKEERDTTDHLEREEEQAVPIRLSRPELHYADVQENEVRQHGVGFYQLASEAEARQEQLDNLNRLRAQTAASRERSARIKEKRKTQMEARLARVKQRRAMTEPQEESKEKVEEEATVVEETKVETVSEDPIAAKLSELRAQAELLSGRTPTSARAPRREWDRGKAMMSAEKYLEQRRAERSQNFAPPSSYRR